MDENSNLERISTSESRMHKICSDEVLVAKKRRNDKIVEHRANIPPIFLR